MYSLGQKNEANSHFCLYLSLTESNNFGTRKRQVMANSAVKKLNNNIHYEGTPEMNSNNVLLQQDGAPSYTVKHHQKSHLYRACDVASKQL